MGLFSFLGGLRLLERFRLKFKTLLLLPLHYTIFPNATTKENSEEPAAPDNGHLHGALASSVSPRAVFASGAAAVSFSAAASLSFATLAPLFTLLSVFVFAPAPSLPGAWTSAPAATSPFPEIVYHKRNILEITIVWPFVFFLGNSFDMVDKKKEKKRKNPGALTSCSGHRAR